MLKLKSKFYKSKSRLLIVAILIIGLLSMAVLYFSSRQSISGDDANYIHINNCKFKVEIADTPQERFLGLGKRERICKNCGMLFEFHQKGDYSFCMRDMKFPLDFIQSSMLPL